MRARIVCTRQACKRNASMAGCIYPSRICFWQCHRSVHHQSFDARTYICTYSMERGLSADVGRSRGGGGGHTLQMTDGRRGIHVQRVDTCWVTCQPTCALSSFVSPRGRPLLLLPSLSLSISESEVAARRTGRKTKSKIKIKIVPRPSHRRALRSIMLRSRYVSMHQHGHGRTLVGRHLPCI